MIAEGARDLCAGMKRLTTKPGCWTQKADVRHMRAPLAPAVGTRIGVGYAAPGWAQRLRHRRHIHAGGRVTRRGAAWVVIGVVLYFAVAASAVAAGPRRLDSTALTVQSATASRSVYGSDRRGHVEYDLLITNVFTAPVTLKQLQVRADGRLLLRLRGAALAAATHTILGEAPVARVPASATVETVVDVVLPRSAGRTVPRRLTNRIDYSVPADAPGRAVIGSTTVNAPILRPARRAPIVIGSPVRGPGWYDGNGCCADLTSAHRTTVLADNGSYVTPEIFAIDWIRVVDGTVYAGNGSHLRDWRGTYGAPLYAVADGTVVVTVDGRPDIAPGANPLLSAPEDFTGNEVVLRIAPGQYAVYFHLERGSVRVRVGQRVRRGQQIGALGNSGNSSAPHLHFGIEDGPSGLANSLPFEIDRFVLEGHVIPGATLPKVNVTGRRRRLRRALPLIESVIDV
jgi:Peptidase family M23